MCTQDSACVCVLLQKTIIYTTSKPVQTPVEAALSKPCGHAHTTSRTRTPARSRAQTCVPLRSLWHLELLSASHFQHRLDTLCSLKHAAQQEPDLKVRGCFSLHRQAAAWGGWVRSVGRGGRAVCKSRAAFSRLAQDTSRGWKQE